MREKNHNGSKLFLTELMITIFFFSIITAVCVQLFADAHVMSKRSGELTQSVNVVANVAESYTMWDSEQDSWNELFPEGKWDGDSWNILYDAEWKPCADGGEYLLAMQLHQAEKLEMAHICVSDAKGNELYSLDVKRVCGE